MKRGVGGLVVLPGMSVGPVIFHFPPESVSLLELPVHAVRKYSVLLT